jgi:hypothetical protein
MGITLIELAAEDWRKLLQSGRESTFHALGRAAAVTGASGLLVRSAAVPLGVILGGRFGHVFHAVAADHDDNGLGAVQEAVQDRGGDRRC